MTTSRSQLSPRQNARLDNLLACERGDGSPDEVLDAIVYVVTTAEDGPDAELDRWFTARMEAQEDERYAPPPPPPCPF